MYNILHANLDNILHYYKTRKVPKYTDIYRVVPIFTEYINVYFTRFRFRVGDTGKRFTSTKDC